MKPGAFEYHRPRTLDEALALLARYEDAKPLAGGQSLIPAMNFRLATPAALVDLGLLTELRGISGSGSGGVRLGAMTTHTAVETSPLVARQAPLLAETIRFVAHPQIRNRGTLGGSLAHADPAAELPAVVVALEATLTLKSASAERRVPGERFFRGLFATALEPGELVTAIEVPALRARSGWAFEEMVRRHGDYALVGVAALLTLDAAGRCANARIALLSVGDGPVLAKRAMAALAGQAPGEETVRGAAELAASEDSDPPSDIHASAAYRRQLTRVLTRRALTRAVERAR
ncbi:MAG TPA: xanthine dehydrogenase family protein subunit M [Gemmatimonadales bacterium]|jgi:CO/xanthine dehydrogenase FAD-binding subunit|nr:xanthine dehydrogenase family protein subunit M [Gemmatimonadales bacterium]